MSKNTNETITLIGRGYRDESGEFIVVPADEIKARADEDMAYEDMSREELIEALREADKRFTAVMDKTAKAVWRGEAAAALLAQRLADQSGGGVTIPASELRDTADWMARTGRKATAPLTADDDVTVIKGIEQLADEEVNDGTWRL